jgi:hypothetical protein
MYMLTIDLTADDDSDKRQIRPLVREGAPHGQNSNLKQEEIGARQQDRQTDWPSVAM